jgi:alpha-1,6-mannosyltransferase
MAEDPKKKFILFHFLFLLSLISVYYIPYLYPVINERFLPPLNRYVRFYIIGIFSLVFIFYYLTLHYYSKLDLSLFKRSRLSLYFWVSTLSVLLFLCASRALLSRDLFEYSLRSRMITVYGLNPYIHTPLDIKSDMFFPYSIWKKYTECYGPLWVILGLPHTLLAKNSFILSRLFHKLTLFAFFVPSVFVFFKLASLLKLNKPGLVTLAFFLNPLVIILTLVDGHNEIAMLFFFLLALYFLLTERHILALFMLTMAINIKFIYTLVIPLFAIYIFLNNKRKVFALIKFLTGLILSAAFTLIVSFPFGKEILPSLIKYYSDLNRNFWYDSIPFAVYFLLSKAGLVVSKNVVGTVFSVIFIIIYAYLLYYFATRLRSDRQAIFTSSSLIILALLFTNYTQFEAWYLLWVIPLILLSRIRYKFPLVLLLSYFLIMTFWKRMSVLALPMAATYFLLMKYKGRYRERLQLFYDFTCEREDGRSVSKNGT